MPLVSVILAVHDDARYVRTAVESVLRQTCADLELVVVDDASTDETPSVLGSVDDPRLVVLRNASQAGLAASLNTGLDRAAGRYVARLDADDVAVPDRLARQVERMRSDPSLGVVGSAVLDLDAGGRPGALHLMPRGAPAVRWHALFGAPFFHPTVLVDRELLERHGLRYDPAFLESEDYELWSRLLPVADGANLAEPLVLKRVHPGQASLRRETLQASFQELVALRRIEALAPDLSGASRAWRFGSGREPDDSAEAARAFRELLAAFEERDGRDREVREAAARTLARNGFLRPALELDPTLPAGVARRRVARARRAHTARRGVDAFLAGLDSHAVLRVTVVSPEPTPYRAPLLDRVAERPEIDLTVVYAAATVAGRTWNVTPRHASVVLRGARVPGMRRVLRHDYPVTPGVARELRRSRPDVVVVSGWSTFASQAAIAWCRARSVPYVLLVESHDLDTRARWRRALKGAFVPPLVRGAAGLLAVGSAARDSLVARGADPGRIRIFANTIDVDAWSRRTDELRPRDHDDRVLVLSVARLVPEKGLDVLARAVAEADGRLSLAVAGDGPGRPALAEAGATLLGELSEDELARSYAEADVFALLSRHEPWGVAVNEAAASGLPLVLSDRVGAARDLLRDGENGYLVPAEDVAAAAKALRRLAGDPELRRRFGARSRELVRGWGYDASVEGFVAAVRDAASR